MQPRPKLHPGAVQAMQQGVGGLHRPVAKPTLGASVTGQRPQLRPAKPQGAAGGVSGGTAPQLAAVLAALSGGRVPMLGPNAALVQRLYALRGGIR